MIRTARGTTWNSASAHLQRMGGDLVVICAANTYDGIKVADQHMAESLSELTPVLYVDPPISWLTPVRNRAMADSLSSPRLRMVGEKLARLTPVVQPGPSRPGMPPITSALTRLQLRHAVSVLAGTARAIVSAWPQFQVFGSCGEQTRVYWAQDDFVGGAALLGLSPKQLDRRERRVAVAADLVVAASPVVADTWRERGLDPALIPYGADVAAYADVDAALPAGDVRLDGPVAGFIGQINERTDLRLLEAIAQRGRSLLLVGPARAGFEPQRFAALTQRPNVRWVGPKPFADLPRYMRLIDVGLVPYADSPFNRSSFPLKTLEYLAAGRAVVATDLPAIRWLSCESVAISSEPRAFADHVDRLLSQARSSVMMLRRQEFAARHSWANRAADLQAAVLGTTPAAAPSLPAGLGDHRGSR